MKKSTLLISLAAAGLIAFGGYSVLAESQDSWNGYCYGPRAYYSSDSRSDNGNYGRGYGCGGWRGGRNSSDDGNYYCPGSGYRR